MRCRACGFDNQKGARFCAGCGAELHGGLHAVEPAEDDSDAQEGACGQAASGHEAQPHGGLHVLASKPEPSSDSDAGPDAGSGSDTNPDSGSNSDSISDPDSQDEPSAGEPAEDTLAGDADGDGREGEDDDDEPLIKPLQPRSKQEGAGNGVHRSPRRDQGFAENGHMPDVVDASAIDSPTGRRIYHKRLIVVACAIVALCVGIGIVRVLFPAPVSYALTRAQFPDAGVLAALSQHDADDDGMLSPDEAQAVDTLTIGTAGDISGLGILPNLTTLVIKGPFKSIDLSDCRSLVNLDLSDNDITQLDTAAIANVKSLDLSGSQIRQLDLAPLTSLVFLDINDTPIETLDVSHNAALLDLKCADTVAIEGLDATQMQEYWVESECSIYRPSLGAHDAQSIRVSATYDVRNRLARLDFRNGSESRVADYSYDDNGNLISVVERAGTQVLAQWTLAYDDAGRLTSARDSVDGQEFAYEYTPQGTLASYTETTTDAQGAAVEITRTLVYDDQSVLTGITGDQPVTLEYDGAGHLLVYGAAAANGGDAGGDAGATGPSWRFAYDDQGRCIGVERVLADQAVCTEEFEYDQDGRLVGATRTTPGMSYRALWDKDAALDAFPAIASASFAYDAGGRLASASLTRTLDDGVETCDIVYRRIITARDYAPVGACLVVADPLQVCAVDETNWMWTPWVRPQLSDTSEEALMLVFDPEGLWVGATNPMSNKPAVALDDAQATDGDGDDADGGDAAGRQRDPLAPVMPGELDEQASRAEARAIGDAALSAQGMIEATTGLSAQERRESRS